MIQSTPNGHKLICQEWPELNQGVTYFDTIRGRGGAGDELLRFYAAKYPSSACLNGWRERIQAGLVTVNGTVTLDETYVLRTADVLAYARTPWREPAAPCTLQVLYCDEHVVVVNKPPGLQVLPGGAFQQRCVLHLLQAFQSSLNGTQSAFTPCHRLGRGTSGALLCAQSLMARRCLANQFAQKSTLQADDARQRMRKIYRALVSGIVQADQGEVHARIGLVPWQGVLGGLFAASANGKPAKSAWKVLRRDITCNTTLVEVEIFTGRPHQIRIHMAAAGHPLVGDPLYGIGGLPKACEVEGSEDGARAVTPGDCGYHLHSMQLEFMHPVSRMTMLVTAPPPVELQTCEELAATTASMLSVRLEDTGC